MAKKTLYFIFSSFIHIFRLHLVSPFCEHSYPAGAGKTPIRSQGSKVQEKTDTDKLFLVEKKQEQAENTLGCPFSEREPVRQANTMWASV